MQQMSIITFSDGQHVEAGRVTRATLYWAQKTFFVEIGNENIRVHGDGIQADASNLNDVRDAERLSFLVFEALPFRDKSQSSD